ncbi:hypothetical protein CDAR_495001 [Caerostris darwini]|uniref:Uncharacterized protein n=1 Tax=Caerostris darwini TaxID=1538125 RepID=A0AAV4U6X6_9ARAC|nr:hypothetical protein CDAR_495001 [Caerostris darwini]
MSQSKDSSPMESSNSPMEVEEASMESAGAPEKDGKDQTSADNKDSNIPEKPAVLKTAKTAAEILKEQVCDSPQSGPSSAGESMDVEDKSAACAAYGGARPKTFIKKKKPKSKKHKGKSSLLRGYQLSRQQSMDVSSPCPSTSNESDSKNKRVKKYRLTVKRQNPKDPTRWNIVEVTREEMVKTCAQLKEYYVRLLKQVHKGEVLAQPGWIDFISEENLPRIDHLGFRSLRRWRTSADLCKASMSLHPISPGVSDPVVVPSNRSPDQVDSAAGNVTKNSQISSSLSQVKLDTDSRGSDPAQTDKDSDQQPEDQDESGDLNPEREENSPEPPPEAAAADAPEPPPEAAAAAADAAPEPGARQQALWPPATLRGYSVWPEGLPREDGSEMTSHGVCGGQRFLELGAEPGPPWIEEEIRNPLRQRFALWREEMTSFYALVRDRINARLERTRRKLAELGISTEDFHQAYPYIVSLSEHLEIELDMEDIEQHFTSSGLEENIVAALGFLDHLSAALLWVDLEIEIAAKIKRAQDRAKERSKELADSSHIDPIDPEDEEPEEYQQLEYKTKLKVELPATEEMEMYTTVVESKISAAAVAAAEDSKSYSAVSESQYSNVTTPQSYGLEDLLSDAISRKQLLSSVGSEDSSLDATPIPIDEEDQFSLDTRLSFIISDMLIVSVKNNLANEQAMNTQAARFKEPVSQATGIDKKVGAGSQWEIEPDTDSPSNPTESSVVSSSSDEETYSERQDQKRRSPPEDSDDESREPDSKRVHRA